MPKLTQTWKQTKNLHLRPNCRSKVKQNASLLSEFEKEFTIDDDDLYKATDDVGEAHCNLHTDGFKKSSSVRNKEVCIAAGKHEAKPVTHCHRKSKRLEERPLPQRTTTALASCIQQPLPETCLTAKDDSGHTSDKRDTCATVSMVVGNVEPPGASFTDCVSGSAEQAVNRLAMSYWGIQRNVLCQYEAAGITNMFEWQAECLGLKKVLEGGNLIYSAPTSAGKTLVAELLMLKCVLERRKKAVMVLPFVSVTHEKMNSLRKLLQPAGVHVDGYMGNHCPVGGFSSVDIAICTIEKANSLVNRLIEENELDTLGMLVVDEFHMVGDPHRGYLLELLITKLRYIQRRSLEDASFRPRVSEPIQIIGMSATIPNLNVLAQWVEGELYCTQFRPVPLSECIKVGSTVYGISDSMKVLRQLQPMAGIKDDPDHVVQMCLETVTSGHAVLVFCPTKAWCEKLAENIAREIYDLGKDQPQSQPVSDGLSGLRSQLRAVLSAEKLEEVLELLKRCPAGLDTHLERTVSFGVAFHHAGLTFDEREIIENAFRRGVIKVLTATSTLSSGVNLPARRVLIRTPVFHGTLLSVLTYKQMIGRAGRKGLDEAGESILVCKDNEKQKASALVGSQLPPVSSCLTLDGSRDLSSCLKRAILEIIVSGIAASHRDVQRYVSCTLLATSVKLGKSSAPHQPSGKDAVSAKDIERCIQFLIENEFIRSQLTDGQPSGDDGYVATPLGKAILASCLSPDEGLVVFQELERARRCFVLENELHVVYQVTPLHLNEQWSNLDWRLYWKIWEELEPSMKRVGECVGVEDRFLMRASQGAGLARSNSRQARQLTVHVRFYTALVLHDLVNEVPLLIVASKYGCNRGMLQALQQSSSTFAGMVTVFCHQLGWTNLELLLAHFQNRLHFGIQQELCDLVRVSCLNGQLARVLHDSGYKTVASLANASVADVGNALTNRGPFKSEKQNGDEKTKATAQQPRNFIWIPGLKARVNVAAAARCVISEAREILQKDLGVDKVEWKNSDQSGITVQQSEIVPVTNASLLDSGSVITNNEIDNCATNVCPSGTPEKTQTEGATVEKDLLQLDDPVSEQSVAASVLDHSPAEKSEQFNNVSSIATSVLEDENTSVSENCMPREILPIKLQLTPTAIDSNGPQESGTSDESSELNLTQMSRSSCSVINDAEVLSFSSISNVDSFSHELVTSNEILKELTSQARNTIRTESQKDSFPFEDSLILTPRLIKLWDKNSSSENTIGKSELHNEEHQVSEVSGIAVESSLDTAGQMFDSDSDRTPSLILTDGDSSHDVFEKSTSSQKGDVEPESVSPNRTFNILGKQEKTVPLPSIEMDSLKVDRPCSVSQDSTSRPSVINEDTCDFVDDSIFDVIPNNVKASGESTLSDMPSETLENWDCNQSDLTESLKAGAVMTSCSMKLPLCKSETNFSQSSPKKMKLSCDLNLPESAPLQEDDFVPATPVESLYSKISYSRLKTSSESVHCLSSDVERTHSVPKQMCLRSSKLHGNSTNSFSKNDGQSGHGRDVAEKQFHLDNAKSNGTLSLAKNMSCSAVCIIDVDVNNSKNDVEKFVQEWRKKSKFSLTFACTDKPPKIASGGIGHNVLKANVQCSEPEMMYMTPIRLYEKDKIVVGLAVCWDASTAYYLNLSSFHSETRTRELVSLIKSLFESSQFSSSKDMWPIIVAFDLKEQYRAFYHVFDYLPQHIIGQDPRLASWMLDPEFGKLTFYELVEKFLPHKLQLLQEFSRSKVPGSLGIALGNGQMQARMYSTTEAVLSLMLMEHLASKLDSFGLFSAFTEIEMPCLLPLVKMELNGFGFLDDEYQQKMHLLRTKLTEIENQAFSLAGRKFVLSSVKEVSKVLFSELKLDSGEGDQSPKSFRQTSRPFRGSASSMIRKFRGSERTGQSTNKEILHKLISIHDLPKLVLEWRQIHSALNKIVSPMLKMKEYHPDLRMNRVYSSCFIHTATGRVILSEPNLQMVPRDFEIDILQDDFEVEVAESSMSMKLRSKPQTKEIESVISESRRSKVCISLRAAFIPFHEGVFVAVDYSQLELRILAHLSQDRALICALKKGADVFKSIAAQWKSCKIDSVTDEERQQAKQICYGMIYGIGAKSLGNNLETDENEAQVFMDSFKSKYPDVKLYIQETVDKCRQVGYVETLMGRRRFLPTISSKSLQMQRHAERQAINTTVQGSAADIVKKAMVEIDKWLVNEFPQTKYPLSRACLQKGYSSLDCRELPLRRGGFLVLQLHDELIYEVTKEDSVQVAQIVKISMEKAIKLSVPLPVKIKMGPSWGALKDADI